MKILLPLWLCTHWEPVEAEIVDVAPHLAMVATFAVHRLPWNARWWRISNVETGCCIPCASRSRSLTIASARNHLAGKAVSDLLLAYRGAGRKYPGVTR